MRRPRLTPLLRLVRPYPRLLWLGFAALALGSAVNLVLPAIVRQSIDGDSKLLVTHPWLMTGLLVGLFGFQAASFYLRSFCFSVLGVRVARDLRSRLYHSLLGKPVEFFEQLRHQDLVTRLT